MPISKSRGENSGDTDLLKVFPKTILLKLTIVWKEESSKYVKHAKWQRYT